PARDEVEIVGQGDLFRVRTTRSDGERALAFAGPYVRDWEYESLPRPFTVERSATAPGKLIALTFDDGPDPRYTAPLLHVLGREGVRATFFVVGRQLESYPWLARRAVREGHLIGNHTFDHPHLEVLSRARLHKELNDTQRALESCCSVQTLLFRSPYDTSSA